MNSDVVLFFQTSSAAPSREKLAGAFRYVDSSDWNVQIVEMNLRGSQNKTALRKWHPIGCIIDRGHSSARTPIRFTREIPTIFIDQNPQMEVKGCWYIRNDSAAVSRMAFTELSRLNPVHYAFVRANRRAFWSREREDVFGEFAARDGVAFTALDDNMELSATLHGLPKPCGILAANDETARNVVSAARKANIAMPGELHVVGINNDEFICLHSKPTITSISINFEEAGYLAMATLHRIARGRASVPRTLFFGPKELVRRGSTRLFKIADPRVSRALDFISAHAADPYITTDRITAVMGCSQSLANLVFRKVTGHTIRDEIRQKRIDLAKQQLDDPTRELSVIPSLCGYRSLTTFARTFKSITGMTMLGWRERSKPQPSRR